LGKGQGEKLSEPSSVQPFLTVVSGLPRSGTSVMMAALAAGGHPVLADHQRAPDEHNPRGYFEHSRVLTLADQADWLQGQEGKAVKILSHLLRHIPSSVRARVLFMRRPLSQVLASQNAMLGHHGQDPEVAALMRRDLAQTLAWLETQEHLSTLQVSYPRLLANPAEQFAAVVDFLGQDLNLAAMAATVDPCLHRQRG
jgi:hypothetical protein